MRGEYGIRTTVLLTGLAVGYAAVFLALYPEVRPPDGYWIRVMTDRERNLLITAHPDRNFTRRMRRVEG
jgi:hypothetical protein